MSRAANYLLDRLFTPGLEERPNAGWWYYSLRYPDFYASLLRTLEVTTRAGFSVDDRRVREGLRWLEQRRSDDGVWRTRFAGTRRISGYQHIVRHHDWVTFRVLSVIKAAYLSRTLPKVIRVDETENEPEVSHGWVPVRRSSWVGPHAGLASSCSGARASRGRLSRD